MLKILVKLKWPQPFTTVRHVLKMTIIGVQGMVVRNILRNLSIATRNTSLCAEQNDCVRKKVKFCVLCNVSNVNVLHVVLQIYYS